MLKEFPPLFRPPIRNTIQKTKRHTYLAGESWLQPSIENYIYDIPNYSLYRQDSSETIGHRGVCVYVCKKFCISSKSKFLIKIGLELTTYSSISITAIFLYFLAVSIALVLALQATFFANILLAFTHHETIFLSLVISTAQIYISAIGYSTSGMDSPQL
ncbi:hypothetical protein WA026_008701 [Henosepilachna vigintioctopunctata]|uniref:Uncharacterized protein n=1 Tax=Henosepilachna vigintioctopunctata TaxID=420089 RepID=A0AAW1V9U4_9CUCU